MCYLKLCFKLEVFCSQILYIVRYVWKYNAIIYIYIYIFFLIDSVRAVRPSCNYVYFVYYYTDIHNSTLIGIFFSKT